MIVTKENREDFVRLLHKRLEKVGLTEEEKQDFCEKVLSMLDFYLEQPGESISVSCQIQRRRRAEEVRLIAGGAEKSPLSQTEKQRKNRLLRIREYMMERKAAVSHRYMLGKNIVTVRSQEIVSRLSFLKSPMLLAVLIGVVIGLVCRVLPSSVSGFLIDGLVSPLLSTVTAMISGIVGPVLFVSMISAIGSLNGIEQLGTLGAGVIRRFLLAITFAGLLTIGICSLVYQDFFGSASALFDPSGLVTMLLSVIPINLVAPFVENNVAQIVILGAAFGTALLMLGTGAGHLLNAMETVHQWVQTVWGFVMKLSPLIPLLNIAKLIYNDQLGVIVEAWRYFATLLASVTLFCVFKLAAAAVRCSVSPLLLLRKLRPLLARCFTYGSYSASIKLQNELVQEQFGVRRTYADFWMPMNMAMFGSTGPLKYVSAVFYAAHASGAALSPSSLLVLLVLSIQFSLASPGLVTALTIIFTQLGLPTDYVGIISVCNALTKNIMAFFSGLISGLEETEAACLAGQVDRERLEAAPQA